MGVINARFWHKAYMLEFIKTGSDPKIFTFSTPPESEDLSFPQRVSETKTYGGAVFDDYGNDTIKITLSGSTFNEEKKLIYQGAEKPLYLTGEKEIFYLQSLINDFGKLESIPGKKIYLYDLSKSNMTTFISGKVTKSYWEVKVKEFKIRRSKDKPFTYYYTLEMIASTTDHNKFKTGLERFTGLVEKVQESVEKVQEFVDNKVLLTLDVIDTIMTNLSSLKKYYASVNNPMAKVVKLTNDSPLRIVAIESNKELYIQANQLQKAIRRFTKIATGKQGVDYKTSTSFVGEKYVVTFDSEGGSPIPSQTVELFGKVKKPSDPTKEKNRFDGWYEDDEFVHPFNFDTEITKSITLYAKWTTVTVTVTYNAKNGTLPVLQNLPMGSVITDPPTPTKPDSLFIAWCVDYETTTEFDMSTPITSDITLYAKYIPQYVVNFYNGNEIYETQYIKQNELVVYPITPVKENYQFEGWYTDEELTDPYDFATSVTESFNLYSKWVQYANNVIFESYGGTPVPTQSVLIGHLATEPQAPEKTGHTFAFWCDDVAATNQFYFTTPVNAELHLYARWLLNNYTVTFNSNGGSSVPAATVAHGSMLVFPEKPTKSGYVFDKWCIDAELTEEYDFESPVLGNMTLYAKWFGDGE